MQYLQQQINLTSNGNTSPSPPKKKHYWLNCTDDHHCAYEVHESLT